MMWMMTQTQPRKMFVLPSKQMGKPSKQFPLNIADPKMMPHGMLSIQHAIQSTAIEAKQQLLMERSTLNESKA